MHTVCETGIPVNLKGYFLSFFKIILFYFFVLHKLKKNIQQKEAFIPHPQPMFYSRNKLLCNNFVWSNTSTETICKETCL